MRILPTVLAFAVLLVGCVSAPRTSSSASTAKAAGAAQKRGDWEIAAHLWKEGIENENGFWRPESIFVFDPLLPQMCGNLPITSFLRGACRLSGACARACSRRRNAPDEEHGKR